MRRFQARRRTVARRLAVASSAVLATSALGLAAAPVASGQIIAIGGGGTSQSAGVGNSGTGTANSGGNASVGNASVNGAGTTQTTPTTTAGLLGTVLAAPITLGAPTNTSGGTSNVNAGATGATGNDSGTGVSQGTGGGGGGQRAAAGPAPASVIPGFFAPQTDQSAGVSNTGTATANTGGNSSVGNASRNAAGITSSTGGLVPASVTLGGPTNNSMGTSNITTGAADATGNRAGTAINQGIGGGGGACGTSTFSPFSPFFFNNQDAQVRNSGQATANTGGNSGIGNASQNAASINQTASGGLVGLNLNLGSPTNNSTGTSNITTGPATAAGNESVTSINQECGRDLRTTLPVVRPSVVAVPTILTRTAQPATLARTGLSTADLTAMAGVLLSFGVAIVVAQRRRLMPQPVAAPFEGLGLGLGLGADDWDRAVTR